MPQRDTVGLVGLGLMGEAIAGRLLAAGFGVLGFDIDPAKNGRLVAMGGQSAASIADLARRSGPIMLAVFSTDQVEQVVEGELLPALGDSSSRIVMCSSTVDPDRIAALAERVAPRGIRFLEVPVSGTSEQVRRGDGVGLIGGEAETAAEVDAILEAICPVRFRIGKAGDGGRSKLAINLILGLNRLALAEGLVFASRLGLDPEAFLKVARVSAAGSQVMNTKGLKMIRNDFEPEGRARQTLKDVHLMLEQAAKRGQRLPALEVHCAVLEACVKQGEGERDNSVIIEEVRRSIW
jgi:3-hydroxyisobutyrate dehydrogenase-like beta-hydroxyacid dehydrogenase